MGRPERVSCEHTRVLSCSVAERHGHDSGPARRSDDGTPAGMRGAMLQMPYRPTQNPTARSTGAPHLSSFPAWHSPSIAYLPLNLGTWRASPEPLGQRPWPAQGAIPSFRLAQAPCSPLLDMVSDNSCLTLRPTRTEFEKPFAEFVGDVFAKNPDLPCFKVGGFLSWGPVLAVRLRRRPELGAGAPVAAAAARRGARRLITPACGTVQVIIPLNLLCPLSHPLQVIPPRGWSPRKTPVNLEKLRISTPIKQHVSSLVAPAIGGAVALAVSRVAFLPESLQ